MLVTAALAGCGSREETQLRESGRPRTMQFAATAHSVEGETATGGQSRKGTVAADPSVLPFGTRIRVSGAGEYSGEYVVADAGRKISGNEIDIYMRSDAEAKRFGRQQVTVEIVSPAPR
jgi:3D (Asp-Asp-Asp) domain-containing protein